MIVSSISYSCDSFPFETTPDQAQAINAVLSDMCQPLAMDRLVRATPAAKTEVAMRAAFPAVENRQTGGGTGKRLRQALAQQHWRQLPRPFPPTGRYALRCWPRFRSAKEQNLRRKPSG